MPSYIIPVHGLIGSPESSEDKEQYFTYDMFLAHVNAAKEADTIIMDYASDGGFCDIADKMIVVLQGTKKNIISRNSGNVCSAASKMFCLASKENRFFDASKGVFLIHNPWGQIEGDSAELALASKALQNTETEYAKWYATATGADINVIKAHMDENIPLTSEQVESLGFASLVKPTVNAVAKLKSSINTKSEMDKKEISERLNGFDRLLNRIAAKFKIQAVMVADANGKELEFPDLTDPAEIKVGEKVNEGGSPADGEYPQPDGTIYVCEAGTLKEIKPKASEGDEELQALKAENENLKAENDNLKAEKVKAETTATEAVAGLTEVKAEFKKFKAQFSDGYHSDNTPPTSVRNGGKCLSKADLEKML